ncbi:DUF3325 domain-containing protein [Pigmentiphaga aceris]|uniref:DUF3325 domain-containing protein n=1 Tax=Pigmentiphaga aceris TaxID=1940612 RepID=A0A5C0B434_9BURK|nr:DUF3325 domain-containing protein [Pigmentiphaga aceris]QEI07561.1 DUF3325 domain-containing protein [Pigmentiphaga aceris]
MMAGSSLWLNLSIASICLIGFFLLALASARQGEQLLHRPARPIERMAFHAGGWSLLTLALVLCFWGWGWSIGMVAWLGWLCKASATLVFALPRWTETRKAKPMPATVLPLPRSRLWRALVLMLLISGPLIFAWMLHVAPFIKNS